MYKNYLPHIDGLRAISIALVVLYHAGFAFFPGGYIGVDVFFVISGFLITGLILKELEEKQFSFKRFYLRRIKRLMPVYAFVMLATFPFFLAILLPQDLIYHTRLMGLGFLSLSNFYLANTSDGYFEVDTTDIPLVHTWSLAVEEQYYLLWPLLLLLLYRVAKKKFIIGILSGLALAGIVFSEWYTAIDPVRAYYLLPARAFELLMGGMLAVALPYVPSLRRGSAFLLSSVGLLLIIIPALLLHDNSRFPGLNALPVAAGSVLLIYGGLFANPVGQLLSSKPMVGVGKISYSLYLWHWPIFSYLFYTRGNLSLIVTLGAIALAVILSVLTWHYVENPFRRSFSLSGKSTVGWFYGLPVGLFVAIALVVDQGDGYIERFGEHKEAVLALESIPDPEPMECPPLETGESCADILLIGDSHAQHYSAFLKILSEASNLSLDARVKGACTPLYKVTPVYIKDGNHRVRHDCRKYTDEIFTRVGQYQYVVLGGYWSSPLIKKDKAFFTTDGTPRSLGHAREVFRSGIKQSLQKIVDAGATPVIIEDNPTFQKDSLSCLKKKVFGFNVSNCKESVDVLKKQRQFVHNTFQEMKKIYPQLIFIDPTLVICDKRWCSAEIDGLPIYRDNDHLNAMGSQKLGKSYLAQFGSPFSPPET